MQLSGSTSRRRENRIPQLPELYRANSLNNKPFATVSIDETGGDALIDLDYAVPESFLQDALNGKRSVNLYVSFAPEVGTVLRMLEVRVTTGLKRVTE